MPHQSVMVAGEKGLARAYEGVPLTLLQSTGAPSGKTLRGPALAEVVVVTATARDARMVTSILVHAINPPAR
jgi:hypothetical protein